MKTATIVKKPDPLKTDIVMPKIVTSHMNSPNTKETKDLDSRTAPAPVFTVDLKKGNMPIIVKRIDEKTGKVTLTRLGGAENKLSQQIMSGQRMDVVQKGL